jgi:hypothetical protein
VHSKAEALAEDIQRNADASLAVHPDQGALRALQADALQLDAPTKYGDGGTFTLGTSKAFRDTVQADLKELERKGHLALVSIDSSGYIEAVLPSGPPKNVPMGEGYDTIIPGRSLIASPNGPTVLDKN